ncbi:hypothetical protein MJ579_27615 [Klebsiella pneumoniae]|nr:hypothetical protein MJ579_27615 [Klebsiella pneumoniae]
MNDGGARSARISYVVATFNTGGIAEDDFVMICRLRHDGNLVGKEVRSVPLYRQTQPDLHLHGGADHHAF